MAIDRFFRGSKAGFSLLELLFIIIISAMIMGAVFLSFHAHKKSFADHAEVGSLQQNLRDEGDNMVLKSGLWFFNRY